MSDWRSTTLQEIISTIESGSRPKGGVRIGENSEGIPSYGGENISMNGGMLYDSVRMVPAIFAAEMKRGILSERDVLINKDGANTGKSAIYRRPAGEEFATINEHLFLIRCDKDAADQGFLYHFLNSELGKSQIARVITGSAQPGLNSTFPEFIRIDLPPLPEQKRIAEILSGIDQKITLIQKEIASLDVLKTAILEQSLERMKDCPVLPFHEVTKKVTVGIVSKPADHYVSNGVPTLRSMNIKEGKIDFKDIRFISEESNQFFRKSIIREGDLLTVRTGVPGTSAVAPANLDGANCVDIIISTPADGVDSDFLCLQINSERIKSKVLSGQGGLAQQHFNVGAMRILDILLPSLDIQKEISASVLSVSRCIDSLHKKRAKYENIKFAVGDELLSGRKKVSV